MNAKAAKLPFGKKAANIEEQVHVIDAKATQVGAAVLELKDKVDNEIAHLQKEISIMKKMLTGMGIILSVAVIAIIVLSFL